MQIEIVKRVLYKEYPEDGYIVTGYAPQRLTQETQYAETLDDVVKCAKSFLENGYTVVRYAELKGVFRP